MDEIVKAAMLKWPAVPDCYGWLALDARGQWRMRDEACQRANSAGDIIRNPALQAFIGRNYQADANGNWYFQNGPQRVFVDLEVCPWVCKLTPEAIYLHTGVTLGSVTAVLIDELQQFYLTGDNKLCLLDDRDIEILINCIVAATQEEAIRSMETWLTNPADHALHLHLPGQKSPFPATNHHRSIKRTVSV
jgi:hypothetical protein